MKVSVIIPCYNCEDYVADTLNSLKQQSYKDFEIICVNDGSSDNTLQLLNNWKINSGLNMTIVDQSNHGVSHARNVGVERSQGSYIMFCDSDDLFHPTIIERLVKSIEDGNFDVSYCLLSRKIEEVFNDRKNDCHISVTQEEAMSFLLHHMGQISFDCYMYKKKILIDNNIRFDENTKFGEDREFTWKYLVNCCSIVCVNDILYYYRPNRNSATMKKASWRKTDLLVAMKRVEQYMEQNGCSFLPDFRNYMFPRSIWAVAKAFAISRDKELYERLQNEYDVKASMKLLCKDNNWMVALSSWFYCINPYLFYRIVQMKK